MNQILKGLFGGLLLAESNLHIMQDYIIVPESKSNTTKHGLGLRY